MDKKTRELYEEQEAIEQCRFTFVEWLDDLIELDGERVAAQKDRDYAGHEAASIAAAEADWARRARKAGWVRG